ncbi:MAG: AAA family ATPase [Elusimicrobiales bacterium]|nr:AAA family ATPase [Elusimicrobiales bacterium]
MLLKKLTLKDFKQFHGKQEIVFATDNKKNVTVIYGANGRGKTSLYRAIMFCLYGDKTLAQDPSESADNLRLVNKHAVSEAGKDGVSAFVEIEFEHRGHKFVLRRSVLAISDDDDNQEEQLSEVCLEETTSRGNTEKETSVEKIDEKINSILDKRIKEYFLFDGEKMENLTRISREQKRQIQEGIKNLLNIDKLLIANDGLACLLKDLQNQLKLKANAAYKKELELLSEKESELAKTSASVEQFDKEIKGAEIVMRDYNKELSAHKEIAEFLKRRKQIDEEQGRTQAGLDTLVSEFVQENDDIGILLAKSEIEAASKTINSKIDRGDIPVTYRAKLFEKILKDNICICNADLSKNQAAINAIRAWKDKSMSEVAETGIINAHADLARTESYIKTKVDSIQRKMRDYSDRIQQIESFEKERKAIKEQIGDQTSNKDIATLEAKYEEARVAKIKLEQKLDDAILKKEMAKKELDKVRDNVKQLEKDEAVKSDIASRCQLVNEASDALTQVYNDFTSEVKVEIGKCASEIFKELIDKEGGSTFKKIEIQQDYSLELFDFRDKPFLANISAGQRQITSISFIMALARIASSNDMLEVPLFMDTPFGRLSGAHRDKLLEKIPLWTKQWVLLATDTEFTKEEADKLRKTGRWGKIYDLESSRTDTTKIVEKKVDTYTPKRTKAD